jgi:hypothetical protein
MLLVCSWLVLFGAGVLASQEAPAPSANPLEPFERLVGGAWYFGDSYHVFEWGVGQRAVNTRSYFLLDGEPKLVSQGVWFWHPGEQVIKGFAVATDMPVEFFEMTTEFANDRLVSELKAYSGDALAAEFVETWEFVGEDRYVWTLLEKTADGLVRAGGGDYERRKAPQP